MLIVLVDVYCDWRYSVFGVLPLVLLIFEVKCRRWVSDMEVCEEKFTPGVRESVASGAKATGGPVLWVMCAFATVALGLSVFSFVVRGKVSSLWLALCLGPALLIVLWVLKSRRANG